MAEFESAIWRQRAFGQGAAPDWNREDIGPFLRWHRQTAPHHNYVTGAAVLRKRRASWWQRLFSSGR
jgi:hypothetical protein